VDFPEPLTPVIQTKLFKGIFTETFFKLFCLAPFTVSLFFEILLFVGTGIISFPVKYLAVKLSLLSIN
jgi:hypothetical protein